MPRPLVDPLGWADLHDVPEVHDGYPVRDTPHDGEVMRDKDIYYPTLVQNKF